MRIVGVAFSRLDIPGGSKRQRSEPACTCGGGKLGETRTELVVRFWPKAVVVSGSSRPTAANEEHHAFPSLLGDRIGSLDLPDAKEPG